MFIFTSVHLLNIDKNSYDNDSPLDYSKYEHHDANTEECLAACGRRTVAGARPGQSGSDRVRVGQTGAGRGPDRGRTGAGPGPDRGQSGLSRAGLVQTELGQLRNNTNVSNLWSLCFRSPPPETNNSVSLQNWFTSKEGFRDHPYLKDGTTMSS